MNIEKAKIIQSIIMKVLMHIEGISEATDSEVATIKEYSLSDMLHANRLMDGYKEASENGGTRHYVSTSDANLAELYLRVHDADFMTADEFEDICKGMDDTFEHTTNGHGVIIDGTGYYSLVELDRDGEGAEKTLAVVDTPRELYDFAKKRIADSEADD